MNKDIDITLRMEGDAAVIGISGDVTSVTCQTIRHTGLESPDVSTAKRILLSFAKDCYINSGGIEFLISVAIEHDREGKKIRVTGLSEHFKKIFHMVGLSRYVEIFPSEEEALA